MSLATVEEFQHEFGRFQALARRGPVIVTGGGGEEFVWLSAAEYRRLKRLDRTVIASADLSDAELALLVTATVAPASRAFDQEF